MALGNQGEVIKVPLQPSKVPRNSKCINSCMDPGEKRKEIPSKKEENKNLNELNPAFGPHFN